MTPRIGQVPFSEAIAFFRAKQLLGTDTWTDTWHEAHQVSFVVAGARNVAMLADFRAAVDEAIAKEMTKDEFQRQFASIAKRYGWTYRGSPGWRSRVIYETNLRMAYSAGRWAQIQQVKADRPFLRYSAVMDNRTRLLHREWHGTILPVGHAWWNTHFPPNGWNCRCSVVSLAQRDLDKRGWKVSDPPPGVTMVKREVTGRGVIDVPEGIDPGFGYNPGKGAQLRQAQARAAEAAKRAPADIAEAARPSLVPPPIGAMPAVPPEPTPFPLWARAVLDAGKSDGTFRKVGTLPDDVLAQLPGGAEGAGDPDIMVTADALLHMGRASKQARGAGLSEADLLRLPAIVANPDAILRDKRDGDVLLVFTPTGADARDGAKLVVHLGYRQKVREGSERFALTFNAIKSGGLVEREVLRAPAVYEVLAGAV